jgi:hypothetical protein
MSYILKAMRKVEQKLRRAGARENGAKQSSATVPSAESTAWGVEMVSPSRFIRYRRNGTEKAAEAGSGLSMVLIISVTLLVFLTFFICATAYSIRRHISAIATEVKEARRHVDEAAAQMATLDAERHRLDLENSSLRNEKKTTDTEFPFAGEVREKPKVKRRANIEQSRPPLAQQKAYPPVPPAATPLSAIAPQPESDLRPVFDTIETPYSKVYAIQ